MKFVVSKHMNGFQLTRDLLLLNTLIQYLGSIKTYERISTDERSIVNAHSIDITATFAVSIKEKKTDFLHYIGYRNFINDLIKRVSLLIIVHKRLLFLSKLLISCSYDTVYGMDGINYFWSIKI